MTTYSEREMVCSLCGTEQECTVLASTNAFGPPDLDTRPSEMARSAHLRSLMVCSSCGYSAPDLEEMPDGLDRDQALQKLDDGVRDSLERQWLNWAGMNELVGDHSAAGWAYLHAAWASDDSGDLDSAVENRRGAARQFLLAREAG